MFIMCYTSTLYAVNIAIVLSNDVKPYQATAREVNKLLSEHNHTTTTYLLEDLIGTYDSVDSEDQIYIAVGTNAAKWLHSKNKKEGRIIYCMVSSPEENGLSKDIPAYGISTDVSFKKQFALIKDALPKVKTIGVLYNSKEEAKKKFLAEIKKNLPKGMSVKAVAIDKHKTVSNAIEELVSLDIDIIWTVPDSSIYNVASVRALLLAAIRNSKPVFGFSTAFVQAGALIGVGIEPESQASQAAKLVLKVIKEGSIKNKADYIQEPEFSIAINLIIQERLSIEISKSVIKRAKNIFKPKD